METGKLPVARNPRRVRSVRPVTTEHSPYDPAANLDTEERMVALLEAALEDGHPQVIAAALGAIARAQGMARIAKETGLNQKSLYRALSGEGNPELETFIKVVRALGLHLHASVMA